VTLIATAATKKGNQRDLTKESVSLFSGSSFASKEEPQVWGAEPHPVPRSGTARKKAMSGLGGMTLAGRGLRAAPSVGFADSSL